jgi:two-component system LytT family sensor kinase
MTVKTNWYNRKWVKVSLHIAVWAIIFSLPFLLRPKYNENKPADPDELRGMYQYMVSNVVWVCFFYVNGWMLVPRLFNRRKYLAYGAYILLCWAVILVATWFIFNAFLPQRHNKLTGHIVFNTFIFLFMFSASMAYRLVIDRIRKDREDQERVNENLKTELSLLRSQVSPHFMFNVLNNMVALARKKSDLLEPSLIKLSSLMRYMLYDTGDARVPLDREVEYLQSYIDLQQMRFGNGVQVNTHFDLGGDHTEIEPMLLIPFVENAFKHGTGMIDGAAIDISLVNGPEGIRFRVRNKYNDAQGEKDQTSGIGLPNVQRRLDLLYGKGHTLRISRKDNWFESDLLIKPH